MEDIVALVEGGADVNAAGDLGSTPLHEAVEQGHLEVVKFLLEHGASPTVKNELGKTPCDIARDDERADLTRILQDRLSS